MSRRERFATQVAPDITARVRATVKGLQREGWDDMSLASFTEQALMELCARMERDHHDDEPWPAVNSLPRGRKIQP